MNKISESFSHKLESIRKNAPEVYPEFLELGKMSPQSLSIEESVLGALIIENDSRKEVMKFLTPEIFYKQENQLIFKTIQELYATGKSIDILILVNELRKTNELENIGGAYYLTELTNKVTNSSNILEWSIILFEKYILRELIRLSGEIQEDAYSDTCDCFEILDRFEQRKKELDLFINKLSNNNDLPSQIKEAMERMIQRRAGEGYFKSRWGIVNDLTIGWMKEELIIIAARPSMGKTALILDDIEYQIIRGNKCLVFSIEMSASKLLERMASINTGISSYAMNKGRINDTDIQDINNYFMNLIGKNLIIDDTSKITVSQIAASIEKHKPDIVYIDYLQKIDTEIQKGGTRDQAIGKITGGLKAACKAFKIPIIAISTLNRDCEKRSDKRPHLSDMRESGSIEFDADVIATLWRPAFYKLDIEGLTSDELLKHTELNFHKNRNGIIGCVILEWNGDRQLFGDKTEYNETEYPDSNRESNSENLQPF